MNDLVAAGEGVRTAGDSGLGVYRTEIIGRVDVILIRYGRRLFLHVRVTAGRQRVGRSSNRGLAVRLDDDNFPAKHVGLQQ